MTQASAGTRRIAVRLSGGELGRRTIRAPRDAAIRPTPGRVREAVWSMLGGRLAGARVLDVFAGSGAVGIDALSHGAATVTFIERDRRTVAALRATVAQLGIGERADIIASDALRAAGRLAGRYDVVYADPPFADAPPLELMRRLRERGAIDAGTVVVYERRSAAPAFAGAGFVRTRTARYGDVALDFVTVDA